MAVSGHLVDRSGSAGVALERARRSRETEAGNFVSLDLPRPSEADTELVGDVFGFHPLAVEDPSSRA